MTSNHHASYVLGYTRATMVTTKGSYLVTRCESQKSHLSSDRGLQLDLLKLESLVIVGQHTTVNTFPGLVHTARQATKVGCAQNYGLTARREVAKAKLIIGAKS